MRRLKSGLLLGVLVTVGKSVFENEYFKHLQLTLLTVCASNSNRMLFGRPIGGFVVQHYTVKVSLKVSTFKNNVTCLKEVQRIIDNGELVGLTNGFFKQKLDHQDANCNTTFDQVFRLKSFVILLVFFSFSSVMISITETVDLSFCTLPVRVPNLVMHLSQQIPSV